MGTCIVLIIAQAELLCLVHCYEKAGALPLFLSPYVHRWERNYIVKAYKIHYNQPSIISSRSNMQRVLQVEGISKKYILKHQMKRQYLTLRDTLTQRAKELFNHSQGNNAEEEFWALRDIDFSVGQGERVALIGRNGAGKSTLLKILSRIVEPTTGTIGIRGRVASLLEVGTGFHQELTGRENIYLNGAILGMKKREIDRKFDEIVAFAEIEKFLDTPVKRYSSGMYVRLAFAVAAHLEPEILILDEVLAVGDAAFQKKCLGKMEEVSKSEGRTVLFVSHNMVAVKSFCTRGILLNAGTLALDTDIDHAVDAYLSVNTESDTTDLTGRHDRQGSGVLRFQSYTLTDREGAPVRSLQSGDSGRLMIIVRANSTVTGQPITIDVGINDMYGTRLTRLSNTLTGQQLSFPAPGLYQIAVTLPHLPFTQGRYFITLYAAVQREVADWLQAGHIDIEMGDFFGTGQINENQGTFLANHSYTIRQVSEQ